MNPPREVRACLSRRQFLAATGVFAIVAARASRPLAKAPFRLLYGNDTTNLTTCTSPYHAKGEAFRAEMLEASVDEVAGTGVDAHFLQPGLGAVPMWPSKALPLEAHYAWIRERYGQRPDSFGRFVLGGGDVVKVFIERCRQRGQAPFLSVRLNDVHHMEFVDAKSGGGLGMSVTRFYAEHPEYRIAPGSLRGADLALNWAVPEVRARKFALIEELCAGYDLDGLELDFLRFYSFFRLAETTREERCAIMTGFVKDVRALLDRTAREGRHRWLCARVPCDLAAHEPLGIDLRAMAAAGLEMVNASAHYFTTQQHDLAAIRQLAPDAALYFEMCHSTWNGPKLREGYDVFPYRRTTPEQYFTAAHQAYARGADGVSLFNFAYYREHGAPERGPFAEPPFEILPRLRDRAWLARQPQHWFLAPGWRAPGAGPTPVPRKIAPGQSAPFTLDLTAPAGGWKTGGRLRIQGESSLGESVWRARLNGTELTTTADTSEPYPSPYPGLLGQPDELRAWLVPAAALREGVNRVEVTLEKGAEATVVFLDMAVS